VYRESAANIVGIMCSAHLPLCQPVCRGPELTPSQAEFFQEALVCLDRTDLINTSCVITFDGQVVGNLCNLHPEKMPDEFLEAVETHVVAVQECLRVAINAKSEAIWHKETVGGVTIHLDER